MTFDEILEQVIELLQRQGRVSYRALKRRFSLDNGYVEDLKDELIHAQRVAVDEDDRVLVWTGRGVTPLEPAVIATQTVQQPPGQAEQQTEADSATHPSRAAAAERRRLTVLFCDLVDSAALSSRLDPEDFRDLVRAYQATSAEVIRLYDGHVAQYLGDGLLVYFGYPQAHEDDAERAVRTGLGIVEAMGTLSERLEQEKGIRLSVRVGIHTGLAVVGEMGGGARGERLAVGETPNVAARLQTLAEPDTVVMSGTTGRLVPRRFRGEDLGTHDLKGLGAPVQIVRAFPEDAARDRWPMAGAPAVTPMVGREPEITLLRERWTLVKEGMGQVVLLSGEAGIGKTHLARAMKEHAAGEPHARLECRCSPYYQGTAFYPIADLWERSFRFQRDDEPGEKVRKLETALAECQVALEETVPLFAKLLSLPVPDDRYPLLALTPERQRQKTLEAILTLLLDLAARQPVILIVEDLHWADPSTLELLDLLIDHGPTARILVLLTCRPAFRPPWPIRGYLTHLTLNRLSQTHVEQLVTLLAGEKTLPADVLEQIVIKTDGVPLFVEELTKMVLESGSLREHEGRYEFTRPLRPLAIPATLHESLAARLDRLGTAKEVAQFAAVIGRYFPYAILRAVSPFEETTLQAELARLVGAELLHQRGVAPRARYRFKHALIQEAAYQSLLKTTRQQYHQRVAEVLEQRFPETAGAQPELLAHHYTAAGLTEQALRYWQQAGEFAIERSAHAEAIHHLERGLELLNTLPDSDERDQRELAFQLDLGVPLAATKGYAAPEVEQTYARARALCRQAGEASQFFQALLGLSRFYWVRAEHETLVDLGEQLLEQARRAEDPALFLWAHSVLGISLYFRGALGSAHEHLAQGVKFYDREQHRTLATRYGGTDPATTCLSYDALALWRLGYADQALAKSVEMLALDQEVAHPLTSARNRLVLAVLRQFRRENQALRTESEIAIALSEEHGFPQYLAMGRVYRGWAVAEEGQTEEGISEMRQGINELRDTGGVLGVPYYLTLLALACGKVGSVEEGLRLLEEALALADKHGEHVNEAEQYRVKGELLLIRSADDAVEAEACFRRAIEVARSQQARSTELRVAMNLSRLWQRHGRRDQARILLAEIHGWFTEGFDTADLQDARALLEELS